MVARDFIVVGDEAYTREEWEKLERKRQYDREYGRRPEVRARRAGYMREYMRGYEALPQRRQYKREWAQQKRGRTSANVVGSLHDLACTGPTRATGCRCQKIKCYDKPRQAA